jgi:hypothetical protein
VPRVAGSGSRSQALTRELARSVPDLSLCIVKNH